MNEIAKILLASFAVVVFLVWAAMMGSKAGCAARWEDSGRRYDWSALAECRVEDKNGKLVPEKTIRDVQ